MVKYFEVIVFFGFLAAGCGEPNHNQTELVSDTNHTYIDTSTHIADSLMPDTAALGWDSASAEEEISIENWKIEDFIVTPEYKKSDAVLRTIQATLDEWKQAKNPLIATYKGCDFGDYFHLNFEDEQGTIFDFGSGNNSFGEIRLYDEPDFNDNPTYLHKKFRIYWTWKISSFPCCDGEYDLVEAYLPSITKLEVLKSN